MTRSSRHKSSKHSSRDARDYSDSEKDSSLKDRKGREESSVRVSKDSGSGEKRKLGSRSQDGMDFFVSKNGEFSEEYGVSKRRKDKVNEGVADRWNGGGEDAEDRVEGSQPDLKSKVSVDSKSKSSRRHSGLSERKDENVRLSIESEEVKKSSGKVESKHRLDRDSNRKEGRNANEKEGGSERERKGKEVKSGRSVDNVVGTEAVACEVTRKQGSLSGAFEEERGVKKSAENTEVAVQDELRNPELESELERRIRRRRDGSGDGDKHWRDGSGDGDKHQDDIRDINHRRLSSRDDIAKDGRFKDERYRDKYREDVEKDNKHRDDMQRDERPARDRTTGRSDDRHLRDGKKTEEVRQKKSEPQDVDCNRDRDRDRDRHRDLDRERDRGRVRDRDRDWDRDHDRNRDHDLDRDHSSHFDDRSARYKDNRGKKRSPDDFDDQYDSKSRRVHCSDMEKKSLSSSRVDSDADRGRSQSRQAHVDATMSANRRRSSPNSSSHGGIDKYRHSKQEDSTYRDSMSELRLNATSMREVTGVFRASERVSKHRSMEKPTQMEDNHLGELSAERSPSFKASPMGLMERSPSSTSIDHRYMNRAGVRQSVDVEETGRRSSGSNDARDSSANEDRLSRDLPSEKRLVDESSQAESSLYNRTSQINSSSLIPPPPAFRAGVDSPSFLGSFEDGRANSSTRYKRRDDPNAGRGHGNSWKGVPNWASPVPNGYIPFQHGPPHGGFQAMMPQFPSPPLFGVRPSMEINHSGIPFHIPDMDRFPGHLRPLRWQNMVDGSGPSRLHRWEGNNGVFRDEPQMYEALDWDQSRHLMNGQGWEMGADMWKGQKGDGNMDLPSTSQKEDYPVQAPADDVLAGQAVQRSQNESNHYGVLAKRVEIRRSNVTSPAKETSEASPKTTHEKTPDPSKISSDDDIAHYCQVYLSKLDISTELADPELYNQCMSLLDVEQSANVDEDITKHVNLEDGARVGPKIPNTTLSSSLFPAMKDSVFQRAMDLYKKQSIEVRGMPISNLEKVEENVPVYDEEKLEVPLPTSDQEMSKEPIPTFDQKAEEPVSTAGQEKPADLVPTPGQDVQEHGHSSCLKKSEAPVQAFNHDNREEPMPIFSGEKMDGMTSEQAKSEDADENCFSSLENGSQTATVSLTNDDDMNRIIKTKGNHSAYSAEVQQAFCDAMSGPLCFSDGSSKACEALMPGSNESESVILSRIHHSPESTH